MAGDGREVYLPEDLAIGILLSLPSGSAIARCRCVCRSWRDLLSDTNFIREILSFKTPDVQKSLQILLTGTKSYSSWNYSTLCYETLDPIPRPGNVDDSPSELPIKYNHGCSEIVGCCDGIFCIIDPSKSYPFRASRIVLWNPATSEAKIIPSHCPLHPPGGDRGSRDISFEYQCVGFGFDPITKDYKVVQVLRSRGFRSRFDFTEVYSLRKDSWKTVPVTMSHNPYHGRGGSVIKSVYVHQQPDTSRIEKCYWFSPQRYEYWREKRRPCDVISFDMTREEFSTVQVHGPGNRAALFMESCFMSKGVLVATFVDRGDLRFHARAYKETWALLKFGVGESWIKLFTFQPPFESLFCNLLDLWKDGMCICSDVTLDTGLHKVFSFKPATNEIARDGLEIEGTYEVLAHTYVPTGVPLSLQAAEVTSS